MQWMSVPKIFQMIPSTRLSMATHILLTELCIMGKGELSYNDSERLTKTTPRTCGLLSTAIHFFRKNIYNNRWSDYLLISLSCVIRLISDSGEWRFSALTFRRLTIREYDTRRHYHSVKCSVKWQFGEITFGQLRLLNGDVRWNDDSV